ncbi:MAG TPA: SpaA isopeptide-forming pilin-related protein [Actinomycetota bacterium]|jgi:hypothetical protein
MPRPTRLRLPALAAGIVVLLVLLSIPALAAGKKIFITKTDENFNGQAGVTFELYMDNNGDGKLDAGDTKIDTQVTDSAGKATFANVAKGKYIVHEVPPAGYKANPDEAVEIKNKNKEIVFSNTPTTTSLRLNDPTGEALVDDGTHVFDFGPTIAPGAGENVLVAWNDSTGFFPPGDVSGISTAVSTDGGATWGQQVVGIPTGSQSIFYLGEPSVAYDPTRDRWIVAADAVMATQQGLSRPILTSTSGGQFGFWNNPVNTFPGIAPDPALAHGASLAVDPTTGDIFLGFTVSNANGTSQVMLTRSTDGGQTWKPPVSVSGTGTFDHADVEVSPASRVFVAYADYQGNASTSFDLFISSSTDGGRTFGQPSPIRQDTPKAGTPGTCTGVEGRTVLGGAAVQNIIDVAAETLRTNRLVAVYPAHGPGDDESDVVIIRSSDGGRTWGNARRVGPATGVQFSPHLATTPDGRLAVTYYDSRTGPSAVDPMAVPFDPFTSELGEPESLTNGDPFALWNLDPSFDTAYGNCFGLGGPAVAAPGSGFLFAWADGRDPGPAGNNGIDPNIFFASDLGPFLQTSTSLSVAKTSSKLKAKGDVDPQPLRGAIVRVTLFRQTGGGFQEVASKAAKIDANGDYAASFGRPNGGTCRITAVFEGSEGRAPSPTVTKTFDC